MSKVDGFPQADGDGTPVDLARELVRERAARLRAEEALRLRDELIAMISHDLRNPLSSVVTSTAILQRLPRHQSDPRWHFCLENIARACTRMRRLISDLLDASEMEAGKFTVALADHRAADIVAEIVQLLEVVAADKGLELSGVPDPGLLVRCDRERLMQVLENLVLNAIKYTEQGRVTVVARADDEGNGVCFSVIDSGPGIAPQHRDRVFDKFWRGDSKKEGIGLGLAIAKGIVCAHGGRIWVDSEVGQGTVVHFTVPRGAERTLSAPPIALD